MTCTLCGKELGGWGEIDPCEECFWGLADEYRIVLIGVRHHHAAYDEVLDVIRESLSNTEGEKIT